MVKVKGFTLIEIMIVVAIIGILASVVLGPINDHATSKRQDVNSLSDIDSVEDINNTMVINGELYKCDAVGDCTKMD